MLQFIPTTLHLLASWRSMYLDLLPYAQDMHSESMISWTIGVTGYLVTGGDNRSDILYSPAVMNWSSFTWIGIS